MPMQDEALYYDGLTANAQTVVATFANGELTLSNDEKVIRCTAVKDIQVSSSAKQTFAIVYFSDGASLQINDTGLIVAITPKSSLPVLLSNSWRGASIAFIILAALVFAIYQWGIPLAADQAAKGMPNEWAEKIEETVMKDIDENMCKPSKLVNSRQIQLLRGFAELQKASAANIRALPNARLIFRSCDLIGPNAFNIGRETIILTDEMVTFAGNDEAIIGILAHELGHLQGDHVMRGILRYVGVGVVATALLGDVSGILAAAPTLVMRNQFTQVFEREADAHAIARLKAAKISAKPLAAVFQKLSKRDGDGDGKRWEWLFSHPDSAERAKLFEE
jgi:Zn-dependent protease with chaperone function